MPPGHRAQALAPLDSAARPAGHAAHPRAPVSVSACVARNLPAKHTEQTEGPMYSSPAGQNVQAVEATVLATFPTVQSVHLPLPLVDFALPTGHALHCPSTVLELEYPALHSQSMASPLAAEFGGHTGFVEVRLKGEPANGSYSIFVGSDGSGLATRMASSKLAAAFVENVAEYSPLPVSVATMSSMTFVPRTVPFSSLVISVREKINDFPASNDVIVP